MKREVESLLEIVFKKRNRTYGAYVLRKKYGKNLIISMITALFILTGLFSYPVIASYINKTRLTDSERIVGVDVMNAPKDDITPPPPPPPPPEAIAEKVKFSAPVVVDEEVESNIFVQDELSGRQNTEAPSQSEDIQITEERPPEVIERPKEAEVFLVVEEPPSFPGGEQAMYQWLGENLKYPEEAKQLGIEGRVYLTFVVETDGSIKNVKILRGIGAGCDEEAARVVSNMPKWIPGKQRATAVRVQFNLPVKFTLLK